MTKKNVKWSSIFQHVHTQDVLINEQRVITEAINEISCMQTSKCEPFLSGVALRMVLN